MSFQDPDQREAWAKRAEEKRTECLLRGGHDYHTEGAGIDTCKRCDARDPNPKPRVTLAAQNYRAVYDPKNKKIIIEMCHKDALGNDRWESDREVKSEDWPIYLLLTQGVRP